MPACADIPVGLLTILIVLAALAGAWAAQPIQLRPAAPIYAGALPLDVGDYAIPCIADWNGDGRKDLLVGYRYADKIAVLLNVGTDANPVFATSLNLQAGGVDIQHPSTGCGAPAPFVCDYDGDGKRDLLVGTGAEGYVCFYRNTNTDAAPILAPGIRLTVGTGYLTVPARATPYVYDWDGDGLRDLLCGAGDGYVYFFKNIGTAQAPTYAPAIRLQAAGSDLNLGIRSVVRMFDWDGDGSPDLVGSSANGVYWCRNIGSAGTPVLNAPVPICAPSSGSGLVPINTGARMRLDLADWNNDGVVDLVLGNADGTIFCYEGYCFAFSRLALEPNGLATLEWTSAPFLNYTVLAGSAPEQTTNIAVSGLPSAGKTTTWTHTPSAGHEFFRVRVAP